MRPTMAQLRKVFASREFTISLDSKKKYRSRGHVPDPEKPGWWKYDRVAYIELLKSETEKTKELMKNMIERHHDNR